MESQSWDGVEGRDVSAASALQRIIGKSEIGQGGEGQEMAYTSGSKMRPASSTEAWTRRAV
eukprot:3473243-Rhodomonas_salina.1